MAKSIIKTSIVFSLFILFPFFVHNLFAAKSVRAKHPNIIVIFADDMGYGDVGIFGHPTIKTPNLDKLAFEGQKWTNFYVAAPVCTPSRAGLMTGRLPIRSGMCSDQHRVLYDNSKGGLPESEITIASALKSAGYSTACVGKWHLGYQEPFDPISHGFDYYFGIPYSNDMDHAFPDSVGYFEACANPKPDYFNVPLRRNREIIEQPADQTTITKRYTEEVIKFMKEKKDGPFFIYMAHSMPHVPLFPSKDFEGTSLRGTYGDVIQEIDWSVGQVISALRENGLEENTLVVFTSDNGPWLIFNEKGGSAGLLKGGKGGTYEGGMREPTLMWGPGLVKPGVVMDLGTTMDLLPTFCNLAGTELPQDRVYDGYDLTQTIAGEVNSPRDEVIYYRGQKVYAIRKGAYKAHFITQPEYGMGGPKELEIPELYNLNVDPSEKYNIAEQHPDVIVEIQQILKKHLASVVPVENQLEKY